MVFSVALLVRPRGGWSVYVCGARCCTFNYLCHLLLVQDITGCRFVTPAATLFCQMWHTDNLLLYYITFSFLVLHLLLQSLIFCTKMFQSSSRPELMSPNFNARNEKRWGGKNVCAKTESDKQWKITSVWCHTVHWWQRLKLKPNMN